VGVIFYIWRWFVYHHAVWHILVLAGAVCHFVAILEAV
jgi:hemolysin III